MSLPPPASATSGVRWAPVTWRTVRGLFIASWVLLIAWRLLVFVNPPGLPAMSSRSIWGVGKTQGLPRLLPVHAGFTGPFPVPRGRKSFNTTSTVRNPHRGVG